MQMLKNDHSKVMMAEESGNLRMAQVLIECLCAREGYARDLTLHNTLITIHYCGFLSIDFLA
jgi:hypothetical protein